MTNNHIFWIGIQESEILNTDKLFFGSITMFGSGENRNFAFDKSYNLRFDYNSDNDLWVDFVNKTAEELIDKYPDCRFLLYYPMDAVYYNTSIISRIIGINDLNALDVWDNKFKCREWLGNNIPILKNEVCFGETVLNKYISKILKGQKIVVQGAYSCGGSETWLVTKDNYRTIASKIDPQKTYTISPYIEHNISVNVHLVVYSDEVLILPASVQLISINSGSFEYQGADFLAYNHLPIAIKTKVYDYSKIIGERMRRSGFLGVCGIDYITTLTDVYFSEINPRFQSSTFLINHALHDYNKDFSVQHLHLDCFKSSNCTYDLSNIDVKYSFYKNTYSKSNESQLKFLSKQAKGFSDVFYMDDSLSWHDNLEENTYLYKLIFKRNISSIAQEYRLIVHPNLLIRNCIVNFNNLDNNMLELKIMLLSHGVTLSKTAYEYFKSKNGLNCKEFDALDLVLNHKYYISVPYQTNLTELSPFVIELVDNKVWLYYCDKRLVETVVRGVDALSEKKTKTGIEYSNIAYLGQDRLRVYHRLGCYYKQKGCGCCFCDLENDIRNLDFESIKEVIDSYKNVSEIRHYLIGGGSENLQDDFYVVKKLSQYISQNTNKPIYLMSTPPLDSQVLLELKESGVTEVSFNIEIFDRNKAKEYMPGKGQIPLQTYIEALKNSVNIWGNTGNVRTIFIVGLESKNSLLTGIDNICKLGVSPILSLFKPIDGTPLSHLLPPSDEEILDIVCKVETICKKHNVPMGPTCVCCEDNTLKITR